MLEGFRSECTSPWPCTKSRARAACSTSACGSAPARAAARSCPAKSSIVKKGRPAVVRPNSNTRTIPGCTRARRMRNSSRRPASNVPSAPSGRSSFSATRSCRSTSNATCTSPAPPRPRTRRRRYRWARNEPGSAAGDSAVTVGAPSRSAPGVPPGRPRGLPRRLELLIRQEIIPLVAVRQRAPARRGLEWT